MFGLGSFGLLVVGRWSWVVGLGSGQVWVWVVAGRRSAVRPWLSTKSKVKYPGQGSMEVLQTPVALRELRYSKAPSRYSLLVPVRSVRTALGTVVAELGLSTSHLHRVLIQSDAANPIAYVFSFLFSQPQGSRVHESPARTGHSISHLAISTSQLNVRYHTIYRSPACPTPRRAIRKAKMFFMDWPQLECLTQRSRYAAPWCMLQCLHYRQPGDNRDGLCCHRMHDPELVLLARSHLTLPFHHYGRPAVHFMRQPWKDFLLHQAGSSHLLGPPEPLSVQCFEER